MMQFLFIISSAVLGLKFGKIDILIMKRKSSTARAYPTYLSCHSPTWDFCLLPPAMQSARNGLQIARPETLTPLAVTM
jgi:hypothetical protein